MTIQEANGRIEVSRRAIAAVVADAVSGCYGVVGMAARNLRDGLDEILRRDNLDRGIDIQVVDGHVLVEVYVIVEYGTRLREVGRNVAEAVRFSLEGTLNLPVEKVTVNIQGVRVSPGA